VNEGRFSQSIRAAYRFFVQNELSRQVATLASFKPTDEFRALCFDRHATYLQLFLAGLSSSQFNFQLIDYSFVQFSRLGPTDFRYAFYPSPFEDELETIQDLEERLQIGLISFEEFSLEMESMRFESRRPMIRFEHSEGQYRQFTHPASHLHLGLHSENRLAVERLLTPHAFSLLIAKLFFADTWIRQGDDSLPDGTAIGGFDKLLMREKNQSSVLPVHLFSIHERNLIFVA
jgi:hypothetical protein